MKYFVVALSIIFLTHGYIYMQSGEIHPCKAAAARLGPLQSLVVFGASMGVPPRNIEERRIADKMKQMESFGFLGCYSPALFGW